MNHLALRAQMKGKKPEFIRQDAHKKPGLGWKWRRPKGITSKMRLHLKGYRRIVKKGYRSPKDVRGLTKDGKEAVLVANLESLGSLDASRHAVIIRSGVGMKARREIVQKALETGLQIVNIKDPKEFLRKAEAAQKEKKEKKTVKSGTKTEQAPVRAKKDQKEDESKDRKAAEKLEKDKVLTKGNQS